MVIQSFGGYGSIGSETTEWPEIIGYVDLNKRSHVRGMTFSMDIDTARITTSPCKMGVAVNAFITAATYYNWPLQDRSCWASATKPVTQLYQRNQKQEIMPAGRNYAHAENQEVSLRGTDSSDMSVLVNTCILHEATN